MQSLRNAHAMEKQAIESTENQIERLQNYPELRNWVRDHVAASRSQRERIRACLERRGGNASSHQGHGARDHGQRAGVDPAHSPPTRW